MKRLRLDVELQQLLRQAATAAGESLSELIRQAAADRADVLLGVGDRDGFADVLGVIHGEGVRARRTGEAFTSILTEAERGS